MSLSLLAFILLYLFGIIATIFADISWGVALYELVYFLYPVNRWWYVLPPFRFAFIISVIMIVMLCLKYRKYDHVQFVNFPQVKWVLFMIVLMVIISFYAIWPEEHDKYLVLQLKQLLFLIVAFKVVDSASKFKKMIYAYLVGNCYVAYIAMQVGRDEWGRVEGIGMPDGPDANTTAAVMITAIPILTAYLLKGKTWEKVLSFLFMAVILNGIILINSRGALLGLAGGMLYFLIFFLGEKSITIKQRILILFSVGIVVLLFLNLADKYFWERMFTLAETEMGKGGATRTNFWLASIELALKYPFGLGAGGFEYLSPTLLPEEWLSRESKTIVVHSTYFQALNDFGVIAILLLYGMIISNFKILRKSKNVFRLHKQSKELVHAFALESSFISYLIAATFINRLYAEVFYWLMLFIACFCNIYTSNNFIGQNKKV